MKWFGSGHSGLGGALACAFLAWGFSGGASAGGSALAQEIGAGSLHGTVVEDGGGAPVAGAVVRIPEMGRSEISHGDGSFRFDRLPAGSYSVSVERIGYAAAGQTVRVASGDTARVTFALTPSALHLDPLVVTGSIRGRRGEDVLSPASVVSGAELDRRLDGTVGATLQSMPGVTVASLSPSTARPVIRGLGGDRILILEDGQRPGDLSSTSGDHAVAIEPLTALRIEVVRGPMSLLYGSSALGGVVNVIREEIPDAVPAHAHGMASVEGASVNNGASAGAYATTGWGPVALRAEASARQSGDVQTPAGELLNTEARTLSFSGGAAYVRGWGHAGASYRFYDNDYGIPGGFIGGHERGVDITMRRHTVRAEAELGRGVGPLSSVRAAANYTEYHHAELERSGAIGTAFAQDLAVGELAGRHDALGVFSQGAIGVRAQSRDVRTGGSLRTPSTYDYTVAGYVVEEMDVGPLRLQAGARYDWARYTPRDTTAFISVGGERIPVRPRTFGSISGSLGALYAPRADVRIGASLNRAYRTPDFNELYSNGPHLAANSFDVGDPALHQETGIGLDAFARLTRDRFRAEMAVFRNQLNNFISPSSRGRAEIGAQGGRPRFQYTNEDAVFSGFESDLAWSATPRLALEGTVSYVRARFTSARAPIPVINARDTTFLAASPYPAFIPPLHGRLGVRYEHARVFAGAALRAAARQARTGDFEEPTNGYALTELSGGVRLRRGDQLHTLTLRIDNLFDTEYRNHLSRIKAIMPEPGRNLRLLYRLTF